MPTETRVLTVLNDFDTDVDGNYVNPEYQIRLQVIPWCTTHDSPDDGWRNGFITRVCLVALALDRDPKECEISVGGPDHKWWCDEA